MSTAEAAPRWCAWCGDSLGPRQTGFCNGQCANEFAADYWQQRASAPCCGAEGAADGPPQAFPPETRPVESPGSAGPFARGSEPAWTEEETAALRRILDDSTDGILVSACQAARTLSEEFHRTFTKNAVIGRCDRIGIELPRRTGRRHWRQAEPTPNPFPDNPHGCLWSYGDPGSAGYRFCGGPKMPGRPYCAEHAKMAYTSVPADKADEIFRPADFYRRVPPRKVVV